MHPTAPLSHPGADASGRRPRSVLQRAYAFLVSPKLAIALLVGVLLCCVAGVTIFRGARAWELIFATLWFNGLLVLLAVSSAAAFFTRIWRRKLTLLSIGMIVFHVSFAALLAGVVLNGLFFFHGVLRLTEGETLPNGQLDSYDQVERGRLFDLSRLRGDTTLVKMHRDFMVDGLNKRSAYELAIDHGGSRTRSIIYVAQHLDVDGVRYFCMKEGYSVLVIMLGRDGREIYGGHVPLQSLKQPDGSYLYATGTANGPGSLPFPSRPERPVTLLKVSYRPNTVIDRAGEVWFDLRPLERHAVADGRRSDPLPIGGEFNAGEYTFTPREIRYWVGISVRYDPGLPFVLASLIAGFVGMALTFVGRVRQGAARKRVA